MIKLRGIESPVQRVRVSAMQEKLLTMVEHNATKSSEYSFRSKDDAETSEKPPAIKTQMGKNSQLKGSREEP